MVGSLLLANAPVGHAHAGFNIHASPINTTRGAGMCKFFGIRFVKYGELGLHKGSQNCLYIVSWLCEVVVVCKRLQFSFCVHLLHTFHAPYKSRLHGLQCNHRSWADFFVDTYLTEGRAALLSR